MATSRLVRLAGNRRWERQEGQLRYFAAKEAMTTVIGPLAHHEAFLVTFSKKDGSIVVIPRLAGQEEGLVSRLRRPSSPGSSTVSYSERGRVTRHQVKYSHHLSGRAHFSLTGHTTNEVGKTSSRLDADDVRLFQFDAFWFSGLALLDNPKQARPYLPFAFSSGTPNGITIIGHWVRKAWVTGRLNDPNGVTGPSTEVMNRKTGAKSTVFFLGPPPGYPLDDRVLMLEAAAATVPSGIEEGTVIMFGGLEDTANPDPDTEPGFSDHLMLMYPAMATEELLSRIGSIDIDNSTAKPGGIS